MNLPSLFEKSRLVKILMVLGLLFWYGLLFIRPIDITTGDLGRHLENGKIIVSSFLSHNFNRAIFSTNFYSYTNPDFPFVNHHWASGVIFYLVQKISGFIGLQIFSIILSLATLGIFFYIGYKKAGFWITSSLAVFLMPLIADRREVRPELFSYLFLGIFFLALLNYSTNTTNKKMLWLLPIIFLFWVNLHIYFIFGLALLGIFFVDALQKKSKEQTTMLGKIILTCLVAGLINPFGAKIYLYPFAILQDYGFDVGENLPIWKAVATGLKTASAITLNQLVISFKIIFFIFWIGYITLWFTERKKTSFALTLVALLFSYLGWKMFRNLTIATLFFLPLCAIIVNDCIGIIKNHPLIRSRLRSVGLSGVLVVLTITGFINYQRVPIALQSWGFNSYSRDTEAAQFIVQNNITGNLFNDFNTGSYVIYYVYPNLKPFVDQRPEAYPSSFFKDTYDPMRMDEKVWNEVNKKYDFNVLLLSFANQSQYTVPFIINRLNDPTWAPVLRNRKHIIFLRRNSTNAAVIAQYEIPKEKFIAE